MKRLLMLFVFAFSALLLKADNVDMVTVLPDDVAAFVRLDVQQSALMSKVVFGTAADVGEKRKILNVKNDSVNADKIYAGTKISAMELDASIDSHLQFQAANANALVIEGNIGIVGGSKTSIPMSINRLFINGVELDNAPPPSGLGWNPTPVIADKTSGATTSIAVLRGGEASVTVPVDPQTGKPFPQP